MTAALMAAIEARKPNGRYVPNSKPNGFMFRCPVPGHRHDDAHMGGSCWVEADGTIRVHCHGDLGHEQDDILEALSFAWQGLA
jgi:hypothetical protein